ncbi:MAG: hypothetical protein ACJ77E_19710 [Gaiellaceae bacterium]
MTDSEPDLGYHLRELRADLGSTRSALDELGRLAEPSRAAIRAWITVESALEHDLDVHLPAALRLLGIRELARRPAEPEDELEPDGETGRLRAAAGEIRRHVDDALAALGDGPSVEAPDVARARDAVTEAFGIARRARAACMRLAESSRASRSER